MDVARERSRCRGRAVSERRGWSMNFVRWLGVAATMGVCAGCGASKGMALPAVDGGAATAEGDALPLAVDGSLVAPAWSPHAGAEGEGGGYGAVTGDDAAA